MPRKPTKKSRKPQETKEEEKPIDPKSELKNKLKQKLKEKQLERTSRFVREKRMDDIEEKLEESKDPEERHRLKEQLSLLEKIHEKELNSFSGEFPEYGDSASYGGGLEHPE